jgi:[CysO sulfur-carrier protein]-S-L-cysteine hydrolase
MPPFTHLAVPSPILDEVIAHAREALPSECCGLLAGRVEDGVGIVTTRFVIANDLASPTAYHTNARDLLAAFRAMREGKLDLLAIYHSHPTSDPIPSRRDMAENTYGDTVVHLIVGLAHSTPDVKAWWITEEGYREAEWVLGKQSETPPEAGE